jgi:hypothetical protein
MQTAGFQKKAIYLIIIKTIVICKESDTINTENCIFEYIDFEGNIAIEVSKILHKHQVQSVIIEGGRQTLQTLLMLMFGTKHVFLKERY